MSYTQADIDALEKALASGVRTVSKDGNSVTYATTVEMRRQLSEMKRALAGPAAAPAGHVYPTFGKGV